MLRNGINAVCPTFALLLLVATANPHIDADDKPRASTDSDDRVFGLTTTHQIHLRIAPKDYAAMEPAGGGFPFGPDGPSGQPGRPGPRGLEFEYVHAAVTIGDEEFSDIGVRYKGNATYMMSSRAAKRSFKFDFDRFDKGAGFHGVKKLNLHCGVFDPSRTRESLAYALFRAAGVPAPRTALAEVRLTVPGKFESEYLGVYTLVEQVDKDFLKSHFESGTGLLLKPEGLRGIQYLGENSESYKNPYDGKSDGDEKQWRRLIDFARLVNKADDVQFRKVIGEFLDVDEFLRYLAVNTLLVNFDSFIGVGHNYYLYLVPATNRFVFIPWDLDLAFGSHPMFGPMEQQIDMSIDHPHLGEVNLIDRMLAMPDVKRAFREELRRLRETIFTDGTLGKQIDAIEAATTDALARESKAVTARNETVGFGPGPPGPGRPFAGPSMPLRKFVERRSAEIAAQLAGKSQGRLPRAPFGPGGPNGPGGALAGPILHAADANHDGRLSSDELESAAAAILRKWDKDGNGLLDERELEAAINGLFAPK